MTTPRDNIIVDVIVRYGDTMIADSSTFYSTENPDGFTVEEVPVAVRASLTQYAGRIGDMFAARFPQATEAKAAE